MERCLFMSEYFSNTVFRSELCQHCRKQNSERVSPFLPWITVVVFTSVNENAKLQMLLMVYQRSSSE